MKYLKHIFACLVLLIIGLLVFRDIFLNEGFLVKSDSPVHMIEAEYLADVIIPEHKWINGWYPYEFAGMPAQMYSYQFGIWVVVMIYYLGIDIFLAYKIGLLLAALSVSLVLYFVLNKRFGFWPSLLVSSFFMFQRDNIKLFLGGMWSHAFGLAFLILLIYLLVKYSNDLNARRIAVLGFVFFLIILSHPFVAVIAAYVVASSALLHFIKFRNNKFRNIFYHLLVIVLGMLLSWFYLYPYFDTFGWYQTEYGWGLGSNVFEILYTLFGMFFSLKPHTVAISPFLAGNYFESASLFFYSVISNLPMLVADLFFFYGIFYYFRRKDENKGLLDLTFLFILISLFLGTGFWFLFSFGRDIPFLGAMLSYRLVYAAKVGLLVFSCYGMKKFWDNKKSFLSFEYKKVLFYLFMVVLSFSLVFGIYNAPKDYTSTSGTTPIFQETLDLWSWLRGNIDPLGSRVFIQNTYRNIEEPLITFHSIMHSVANHYTGLNFVGSWYTTVFPLEGKFDTESSKIFGIKAGSINEEELINNLKAYNVRHIVAVEPELKSRLSSSKNFKVVYKSQNYVVFEFLDYSPEWLSYDKKIEYNIVRFDAQDIDIKLKNNLENNKVALKVAYHPYWKAFIDNKEINLSPDEYGLIGFVLPNGEYNLKFVYNPVKLPHILVSVFAFALLFIVLIYNKIE